MVALLLAAVLAAPTEPPPAALLAPAPPPEAALRLQEDWEDSGEDDGEDPARIRLTAWGGEALGDGGTGRGSSFAGGEASYAFDTLDVGVGAWGYRDLEDARRTWTPVVLARFVQRFRMRRDVEAAFGFGIGAGRPRGWEAWYQLALGVRVPLGPLFLAGELAFEQNDLLRLGAGVGAAF